MAVVEAFDSVAIRPPPIALALVEGQRALAELATLPIAAPFLRLAPRGDGHPVMVLPGFMAGGGTTMPLRYFIPDYHMSWSRSHGEAALREFQK